MYFLQTSFETNPSIRFERIEIILVAQHCHYYEHFEFWQHHQITFSMITLDWEHLIDHNSIMLQFSHRINLANFFSSYLAFLQCVHNPTYRAFYILCVVQTMANYKIPPACFLGMSVGSIDVLKGNFFCLYFGLQQPPEGFNYRNLQWVNKEISGHGFRKVCAFLIIPWSRVPDF